MADAVTVEDDEDIRIRILDNDDPGNSPLDQSSLIIITEPLHAGKFRVHKDHLDYKSVKDYSGLDFIDYRICNTNGLCDIGTVTITVEDD